MAVVANSGDGSSALFGVLVVLHVAAALTGFASIGLAGTYAARAAHFLGREGPGGEAVPEAGPVVGETETPEAVAEELVRYFRRPAALWWALLAVPWLGLGALASDPGGGGLVRVWTVSAFAVWLLAGGLAGSVVVPALRRVGTAVADRAANLGTAVAGRAVGPGDSSPRGAQASAPAVQRAAAMRSARTASWVAGVCDALFLVALALMIWQP
jgi:hypothetical protein